MHSPSFQENNVLKDLSSLPIPKGSDKGKQLLMADPSARGMDVHSNPGVPEMPLSPLVSS